MSITPVTSVFPVRSNNVTFSGRNNNYDENVEYENESSQSSRMSGLRKVPVMVLMAMSPLTVPNTAASEISEPEPAMVESMSDGAQQQINPVVIGKLQLIRECFMGQDAKFYVGKFDFDGNQNTVEALSLRVEYDDPNSSAKRKLRADGVILNICTNTVNSNGDYMILYSRQDGKQKFSPRVCRIPYRVGQYIMSVINSPSGDPLSDMKMPKSYYENEFGRRGVSPLSILGECNKACYPPNYEPSYIRPENDK